MLPFDFEHFKLVVEPVNIRVTEKSFGYQVQECGSWERFLKRYAMFPKLIKSYNEVLFQYKTQKLLE